MGLVVRLNGVQFPESFPTLQRDPLIVPGTLLLHDYRSAACWPAQAKPDALHDTVKNLVRGGADGTISQPDLWNWDGAGGLVPPLGTHAPIRTPNLPVADRSFLVLAHVRVPAAGASYSVLCGQAGSANSGAGNQWWMYLDGAGTGVYLSASVNGGTITGGKLADVTPGEWVQVGFALTPNPAHMGLLIQGYLNGAAVGGPTAVDWVDRLDATARPFTVSGLDDGGGGAATIRRVLVEDLTASGRSPGAVMQADWARR